MNISKQSPVRSSCYFSFTFTSVLILLYYLINYHIIPDLMATTLQRNDPCRCGSGKKYKHCCQQKDLAKKSSKFGMIALGLVVLFCLALALLALSGVSNPRNSTPVTPRP